MAYWTTHLIVGEEIRLKTGLPIDLTQYYIGCCAPDSGIIEKIENGKRSYIPPKTASHWMDKTSQWDSPIHYERFYDGYVKSEKAMKKYSFYLGYYFHLLTDALWIEVMNRPWIKKYGTLINYRLLAGEQMRRDWLACERLYLTKHPGFLPLETLKQKNDWDLDGFLDCFPGGSIKQHLTAALAAMSSSLQAESDSTCVYITYDDYMNNLEQIINLAVMTYHAH